MKLIKITDDHYVILDQNAEIKEGDWIYNAEREPSILKCVGKGSLRGWQKITHSTNILTNGMGILYLSEVKELIGEVDVDKKAEYDWMLYTEGSIVVTRKNDWKSGFHHGYNQAIEDNKEKKYTNEDMLTIRNQLVTILPVGDVNAWDMIQAVSKYTKWLDEYVESIHQPTTQWDVEFDSQYKLKLV